jgi:hypothetical protein
MAWETRNAYNSLIGKLEGRRPLGRPGHRWEDNITMDLLEIGWEGVDWMHLAQTEVHLSSVQQLKVTRYNSIFCIFCVISVEEIRLSNITV